MITRHSATEEGYLQQDKLVRSGETHCFRHIWGIVIKYLRKQI